MRRVLFTEGQLRSLLGENFETYLPKANYASEESSISYGTEVSVSDKTSNGDATDVVTTDRFAKSRSPKYTMYRSSQTLAESNQDLDNLGKSFNLGKSANNSIKQVASDSPNDKMLNNMASDENMTANCAYTRNNRLEKMKEEDPERYERINGKQLQRIIQQKLKAAKNNSYNSKKVKKECGIQNAFQKSGGTKQYGNGKAHTQKQGDMTFSFES